MLKEQWKTLVDVSGGKKFDSPPTALIVDSLWLPFYAGISHFNYYLFPNNEKDMRCVATSIRNY